MIGIDDSSAILADNVIAAPVIGNLKHFGLDNFKPTRARLREVGTELLILLFPLPHSAISRHVRVFADTDQRLAIAYALTKLSGNLRRERNRLCSRRAIHYLTHSGATSSPLTLTVTTALR